MSVTPWVWRHLSRSANHRKLVTRSWGFGKDRLITVCDPEGWDFYPFE